LSEYHCFWETEAGVLLSFIPDDRTIFVQIPPESEIILMISDSLIFFGELGEKYSILYSNE